MDRCGVEKVLAEPPDVRAQVVEAGRELQLERSAKSSLEFDLAQVRAAQRRVSAADR